MGRDTAPPTQIVINTCTRGYVQGVCTPGDSFNKPTGRTLVKGSH